MNIIKKSIFTLSIASMSISAFGSSNIHVNVNKPKVNVGRQTLKRIDACNKTAKNYKPIFEKLANIGNKFLEIINQDPDEKNFMDGMNCNQLLDETNCLLDKTETTARTIERIVESPTLKQMVNKVCDSTDNVVAKIGKKTLENFSETATNAIEESKKWLHEVKESKKDFDKIANKVGEKVIDRTLNNLYWPIRLTCGSFAMVCVAGTCYLIRASIKITT